MKCCVAACGCVSRGVGAHSCVFVWFTHSTGLRRGHDEHISPIVRHLFVYIPDMLQGDRETDTISLPGLSVHHSMPLANHNLSTSSQIDRGWCSECRNGCRSKAIRCVESTGTTSVKWIWQGFLDNLKMSPRALEIVMGIYTILWHFIDQVINWLIETVIQRLLDNKNCFYLQPQKLWFNSGSCKKNILTSCFLLCIFMVYKSNRSKLFLIK